MWVNAIFFLELSLQLVTIGHKSLIENIFYTTAWYYLINLGNIIFAGSNILVNLKTKHR